MRKITLTTIMLFNIFCFCTTKGAPLMGNSNRTDTIQPSSDPLRNPNKRSAINIPSLYLDGNLLFIIGYMPSCTLQLVDETGNIFYEAYIPEGAEQWQLPTAQLEGCELRLIIDGVCYYCIL